MGSGHLEGQVNIITHIHTDASSAETSELNDRIRDAIRRCAGVGSRIGWAECFTTVEQLEALLAAPRGDRPPVHMILITDHMRRHAHRLVDRHLAAAARNHRLALGAELATRTLDADGRYRRGPEILAYGGPHLVKGPHGPYYGLAQATIDELYATCLDDEGQELCTRRARDLLQRRGIAQALSHPLDGHDLSLEGTLAIISEFAFIETLNGGHSETSARLLAAYVQLNNALRAGATLPAAALGPAGKRIVRHIRRRGRFLHPWSGSDAHVRCFDRVVTSMAVTRPEHAAELTPGDLFKVMLSASLRQAPTDAFLARGRPATYLQLLIDVICIVVRNIRQALGVCCHPVTWAKILTTTAYITWDELRWRRRMLRRRLRQLETEFNPLRLLPQLRPPVEPGVVSGRGFFPARSKNPRQLADAGGQPARPG